MRSRMRFLRESPQDKSMVCEGLGEIVFPEALAGCHDTYACWNSQLLAARSCLYSFHVLLTLLLDRLGVSSKPQAGSE